MRVVFAEAAVGILLREQKCGAAIHGVAEFVAEREVLFFARQRFVRGVCETGEGECGEDELAAFHLGSSLMVNVTGVSFGGAVSLLTYHWWSSFEPLRGLLMSAPGYVTSEASDPSVCATKCFP